MKKQEKEFIYAAQIAGVIATLFTDEGDYHIDQDELQEGDNLTHFMHALANLAPTILYNKITGDEKNNLEFNHLANQLCFQYSKHISLEDSETD